jgi:3-oxoacyl-ACP reductase-like protein
MATTAVTPSVGNAVPAAPATPATPATAATAAAQPGVASTEMQAQKILNDKFTTSYEVAVPGGPGQLTLSGGINLLARMYGARQTRLADISLALANYTNTTGNLNQAAVIKVQQENSSNDILNSLIKSLFDKQQDSIRSWTQLR